MVRCPDIKGNKCKMTPCRRDGGRGILIYSALQGLRHAYEKLAELWFTVMFH